MKDEDVDYEIVKARKLAFQLNNTLDGLVGDGIICVSVVGGYDPNQDFGRMRDVSRISLCLDFKPKKNENK